MARQKSKARQGSKRQPPRVKPQPVSETDAMAERLQREPAIDRLWPDGPLAVFQGDAPPIPFSLFPLFEDKDYLRFVRDFTDDIRKVSEDGTNIFQDLSSEQSRQLVRLILHSVDAIGTYHERANYVSRLSKLVRSPFLRLDKRVSKVREALSKLAELAAGVDPRLGLRYKQFAEDALTRLSFLHNLSWFKARWTKHQAEMEEAGPFNPYSEDPTQQQTVALFRFFNTDCGFHINEAEVRVGLIRNGLWTQIGVDTIGICFDYDQVDRTRGCDAVRLAVTRLQGPQGTTR